MENILWIILSHYILDYPLQGEFLATTKGYNRYSLLAHSTIYGLGMALTYKLLGTYKLWKVFVLIASHAVIDHKKANAKDESKAETVYLYIDQALHIIINLVLYKM